MLRRLIAILLGLFIILALLLGSAYGGLYWWFHHGGEVSTRAHSIDGAGAIEVLEETPINLYAGDGVVLFEIPRGAHRRGIARSLEERGFLTPQQWNQWAVRLFMPNARFQAGVYALNDGETPAQLWTRFARGNQHLFSITFVEGSEFKHWQAQLEAHPYIRSQLGDTPVSEIMSILGSDHGHPEGLLFPDTYRFYAGTTDLRIYQQAFQRMQTVLQQEWEQRDRTVPLSTPYEALVLASIVERETGATHERGLVASVFVNRLHTGMRLQSDPTIIYGLGDRYRGVIYRSDIQEHTPYNTYRIDGLPPTPIAMPGAAAIRATLQPESSEYYYFVSRNDGTHVFSRTLAEHNRAVNQYQRNR
ncbi:endolytic transglycosylase MltG [Aliidiomarina halalkaliphila]|uniref:Endolytic murein transglycosylase n=1 Tax=Aliidiomarina halalkaliphila TaxID=2593535 RepID=A0A552X4A7_9GAMM|nr:endolytic transglycosylase MltG [Aliidiomarina halalkaliphila]TRW49796.1 endolytic transglycosylase MltG [Aliidiomarina halalkaliphila]